MTRHYSARPSPRTIVAEMKKYATMLTIAGSDSIGGAGIQADIKTCCAHDVYAMTAITAVTAQNTLGVNSYSAVGPKLLREQLDAVCADVRPDAVKIGMVPDAESAAVIADVIERYELANIVVDPVMVATSGHALSDDSAMGVMCDRVFSHATVLTPNMPEARTLMRGAAEQLPMAEWASWLADRYLAHAVLLKGGHGEEDTVEDILWSEGKQRVFAHQRIHTPNTHGTGCSLSSAIACNLALGKNVTEAVKDAIYWLSRAIEAGADYAIGHGHGPVKHISTRDI